MGDAEPDIAELFAPLRPAQASDVVLSEARQVLPLLRAPIDAELWGSDMIGALSGPSTGSSPGAGGPGQARGTGTAAGQPAASVMAEFEATLVPAAERSATPEALALLRILGAIGAGSLRAAATSAAERVARHGVPEQAWAAEIGSPKVGRCWHYSDIGGRQESLTLTFGYGGGDGYNSAEHALSVLIDHGNRGRIKDAWVSDADGLLDKTWLAAQEDPLVIFEEIEPADAGGRLARAADAGECPVTPDQADDLAAHRALLRARLRLLESAR